MRWSFSAIGQYNRAPHQIQKFAEIRRQSLLQRKNSPNPDTVRENEVGRAINYPDQRGSGPFNG